MEQPTEPTFEQYGLTLSSYENLRIQKKDLVRRLDRLESKNEYLVGGIFFTGIILSLIFQSGLIFIIGLICLIYLEDFFIKKRKLEINNNIRLIKDKAYPFEQASIVFYKKYLDDFFIQNLSKKKSGTDTFEDSLSRYSSMIQEVKQINSKLIFSHINIAADEQYLRNRVINHNFQKSKNVFKSFAQIKDDTVSVLAPKHLDIKNEKVSSEEASIQNKEDSISRLDTKTVPELNTIPPEKLHQVARKIDWDEVNKKKKLTGMRGEEIVLEKEKDHLVAINRRDLADKVSHVSKEEGDGKGYDILSFFPDGNEKYIEVKSTIHADGNSFYLSKNELEFLKRNEYFAYVYKVFNVNEVDDIPHLKVYEAAEVLKLSQMIPVQYLVRMD